MATILCFALFALAFVAAPRSCESGLSAYFWAGVAVVLTLLALPFVPPRPPLATRVALALGLGVAGVVTWAIGLFTAGVRIMCRLF